MSKADDKKILDALGGAVKQLTEKLPKPMKAPSNPPSVKEMNRRFKWQNPPSKKK